MKADYHFFVFVSFFLLLLLIFPIEPTLGLISPNTPASRNNRAFSKSSILRKTILYGKSTTSSSSSDNGDGGVSPQPKENNEVETETETEITTTTTDSTTFVVANGESSSSSSLSSSLSATKKIVSGRKTRVVWGYRATMAAYIVSSISVVLIQQANSPSALYFASGQTLAGGIAYVLASAAQNNRLNSDTYKRLNLGLMEYGLVGLTIGVLGAPFRKDPFLVLPALLATIHSLKGYFYAVLGWDKNNNNNKKTTTRLVQDFWQGTKSTTQSVAESLRSKPKNVKSFLYLGATLLVGALTLSKAGEIVAVARGSPQGGVGGWFFLATRLSRFGRLAFLATVLYTLKDAADRDRLEGTTFIELNFLSSLAMAAMSVYYFSLNNSMNMNIGTTVLGTLAASLSTFCAWSGLASNRKKKQKQALPKKQ